MRNKGIGQMKGVGQGCRMEIYCRIGFGHEDKSKS